MDKLFIIKHRPTSETVAYRKNPTTAFFDGFKFLNPGTGKPNGHWIASWNDDRCRVISESDFEQVKKDLYERLKLAEGIDYDLVQVG